MSREHEGMRTHRVRYGETLSTIAGAYYGRPELWERIYQANRHYIANPSQLDPGQSLVIPHLFVPELRHLLGGGD